MTTAEPSGQSIYSPKIRDQALVRKFISQNGSGYVALSIVTGSPGAVAGGGSKAVDSDAGTLTLQVWFNDVTAEFPTSSDPRGTQIINVTESAITRTDTGMYYYDIGPQHTAYRGVLTVQWNYRVNGVSFTYTDNLQILEQQPLYDSLNAQEQSIIEQVSWMMGDLFDSTEGGPYLIEPFQTHYNYERLAQLETIAVTRLNLMSNFNNPPTSWGVGPGTQTVPPTFAGLLVIGTYLELVRHLIRSYTEMPNFPGTNVTFVDRRDYAQRWQTIFQQDWPEYQMMVRNAKISLLNMSSGSLLVAGGIYGGSAMGIFQAGTYASQVRSWRFYPAAPAISWGATGH